MDHPVPLHLPSKVFCALTEHTGEGYFGDASEAALCELITHWIATTAPRPCTWLDDADEAEDEDAAAPPSFAAPDAGDSHRGYQWKELFLPNGTELRAIHAGRSLYATVEQEQIICDGASTTPSRLANARGCGTRNAWHALWLRFPGSTRWQRAAHCREQTPHRARRNA